MIPKHILLKIQAMFGTKELKDYLTDILLTTRTRQGFQKDTFNLLADIYDINNRILNEQKDVWDQYNV